MAELSGGVVDDMAPSAVRYSRVYWEILDDPKFTDVYDDDAALATWLRLLIVADMAYPAAAPLPAGTAEEPLSLLESAALIERVGRTRYRVRGLAAERERRSSAGKAAAGARWGSPDATAMRTHYDRNADALLAEQSKAETSRAEQSITPAEDPDDHLDAYYRLTGSWPSAKVLPWLNDMAEAHGGAAVSRALAEEIRADSDRRTLLSRTEARLERSAHEARKAREERQARADREEQRKIEQMPEEERAANMARLRDMMVSSGLLKGGRD